MLNTLYAAVARGRRQWFDRHPEARRHLARPVVSVGNLAVGGSGKTPVVAHLARLLLAEGERPAVLSRGYARRRPLDGVVIVRDREGVRAGLDTAGDEPLMLARRLDGVPVLVAADRHLAGLVAERHLDASVHLLDDGFQHMMLARDADLVLVDARDVADARTLPGGRLREPIDTIARADAVIVTGDGDGDEAEARLAALGARKIFRLTRHLGGASWVEPRAGPAPAPGASRAVAFAAIARPERFMADLAAAGWDLAGDLRFRDHHRYSRADVGRIARLVSDAGASVALTSEKDLVRLLPHAPLGAPVAWVPLEVAIEPADDFRRWLLGRLAAARKGTPGP